MKTIIKISTILLMTFLSINMFGQNNSVTIGGTETITDAVLWLIPSGNEGKQGLVLPQVERTGFVPSMDGMIIFDPSDQTIYMWDGTAWQGLGSGGTGTADDWGTQTVVTDPVLTGDGTAIDPLTLAPQDAGLGQVLKWNGSTWAPAVDETGEGGSSVNSINEITGDGTLANPLQLAQQAATVGQILKWDGTAWTPADDAGGTGSTYLAGLGIEIDADNNIINTGDADADPANEFQTLSFDVLTNELSLSDGNSISIPTGGTDADADPTNEIQTISFDTVTNELTLSEGGTVTIPTGGPDADADPTNEFQTLSFDALSNELTLSDGNSVTIPSGGTDADADPTNEIQDLTLSGTTIEISGGTGVDIAALIPPGGTDDQNLIIVGDELSIEGGTGSVDLSVYGDDADADPTNEIQTLSFDALSNELTLSDGNTVTIPSGGTDADADPTNEIQDLTLSGTVIEISGGTGVDIAALIPPGGTDDQNLIMTGDELSIEGGTGVIDLSVYGDDADADPTNEIQTLSFDDVTNELSLSDGNTISIPTGGSDADADPTNEIQDLTLSGTTIEISGGTGVDIAALIPPGGTDDQNLIMTGDELSIEGGTGVIDLSVYGDDADADPTNEIQDLTLTGSTINISGGAGVDIAALIPPGGTDDQNLIMTGDELSIEGGTGAIDLSVYGDDADADPTNEIQDLTLTGSTINISGGAGVDISTLIPPGGTDDQDLELAGDILTIEGGAGSVDLSVYGDDADADPFNEIQTITYNGLTGEIQLSDGGGTVTLPSGEAGAFVSDGGVVKPTNVNDDDFVFGSNQLDDDNTTEEDDKRMIFDKSNGSFRVGLVSDDTWNEENLGLYSFASGVNTRASAPGSVAFGESTNAESQTSMAIGFGSVASGTDSFSGGDGSLTEGSQSFAFGNNVEAIGNRSTAHGNQTEATGANSTAIGNNTLASGENSTAMGFETSASGENSTAMGNNTIASGQYSTALGIETTAEGDRSTALGEMSSAVGDGSLATGGGTTASGVYSFSTGIGSIASGHYSVAMGAEATSDGLSSFAMGYGVQTIGAVSAAMGYGTQAESFASMVIGQFNIGDGGSIDTWELPESVFEVGIGLDDSNRENALTILKNGRVGITEHEPSTDLVIGSNFPFNSSATVPIVTVGGSDREGGAVVIGDDDRKFWLQSNNSGSGIISLDNSSPSIYGDFYFSALTLQHGTITSDHDYMIDVAQREFSAGVHQSNGDVGWEHVVSGGTGNLELYTDADFFDVIGSYNYTSGAYSALSDRSTKEDVKSIGTVLSKVNELEPLRYQFIGAQDNKKSLGFIAQDVKEIFPELVTFAEGREGGEGRHLMDYSGFGVIAIAAIQEQQKEIEDLKSTVEALMKRVERLEDK